MNKEHCLTQGCEIDVLKGYAVNTTSLFAALGLFFFGF